MIPALNRLDRPGDSPKLPNSQNSVQVVLVGQHTFSLYPLEGSEHSLFKSISLNTFRQRQAMSCFFKLFCPLFLNAIINNRNKKKCYSLWDDANVCNQWESEEQCEECLPNCNSEVFCCLCLFCYVFRNILLKI